METNICKIMITRRRRVWQENNGSRAECLRREHGERTTFGRRTRHMTAHRDGDGIYTGNPLAFIHIGRENPRAFSKKGLFWTFHIYGLL